MNPIAGMDYIDPVPLSDEDFDDYGGGVTYVGPAGPETGAGVGPIAVRIARRVEALRIAVGASRRC